MKTKRITKQKKIISDTLKDDKSHPSAYELYDKVKNIMPEVGIATIYRNLNQMAEEGIIKKATMGGIDRYDADLSYHSHLVCKSCGNVYDIFDDHLINTIKNHIKQKKYKMDSFNLSFNGICEFCSKDLIL